MLGKLNSYVREIGLLLITVALLAGMAGCNGGGYNPPPSKNLEIRTWYDLDDVRDNLAGNHTLMNDLDSTTPGYPELASPTANGGKGWQPIGIFECNSGVTAFRGTFDGQGYEIRNLFIDRPDDGYVGLFKLVHDTGVIQDIAVLEAIVTGVIMVGGLAGENQGTVNNSRFSGSVAGDYVAGGLAGLNRGTVSDSYSAGSVTGDNWVGGLLGANLGTVINSHYDYGELLINGEHVITIGALFSEDFDQWLANGRFLDVNNRLSQEDGCYVVNNVTDFKEVLAFGQNATLKFRLTDDLDLGDEPNFYIPYLAGEFDGNGHRVSSLSFNSAFIIDVGLFGYLAPSGKITRVGVENASITAASSVGGLVGHSDEGTVSNCLAIGNVTAWGDRQYGGNSAGGLVGCNEGAVSNSSFGGSVTGDGTGTGGLVGANGGTVSNSYSISSVSGTAEVGGVVGQNGGIVSNCYSAGNVTGSTRAAGGLVGLNGGIISNCYSTGNVTGSTYTLGGLVGYDHYGTVTDSFWDTQTSGQSTSYGGTGKNTTEMQDIATFLGAGWNITAVALNETNPTYIWNIVNNVTYPFLGWQP